MPSFLFSGSRALHLLFDFFELLDVLYFDIVWVVCQQMDGVGHHVLRQQREQLVCWCTQSKYYSVTSALSIIALSTDVHCRENKTSLFPEKFLFICSHCLST